MPAKTKRNKRKQQTRSGGCDLFNRADGQGLDLYIYGEIGPDDWLDEFVSANGILRRLENHDPATSLRAFINSPGGSYTEGVAIYNLIRRWEGETIANVDGWAASVISLITMGFDQVVMSQFGMFMIHNPMLGTFGDEREHAKSLELLQKTKGVMIDAYAGKSGKPRDEIAAMMDEETWFTPEESLAMGFADSIVDAPENSGVQSRKIISAFNRKTLKRFKNVPTTSEVKDVPDETKVKDKPQKPDNTSGNSDSNSNIESMVASVVERSLGNVVANAVASAVGPAVENVLQEQRRQEAIQSLAIVHPGESELLSNAITEKWSLDTVKAKLFDKMGQASAGGPAGIGYVQAGEDSRDKFVKAVSRSWLVKARYVKPEKNERENEFFGFNLVDVARHCLRVRNVTVPGDRMAMVGLAFTHTESDFPQLLEDTASKSMIRGWETAPETYQMWTVPGNLTDFKTTKRLNLEWFSSLPEVPDGANYTYATVAESGETIALGTFGHIFTITRKTIINDDLDAFTRIPLRQGSAARATMGDLAYDVLTLNPLMSDGTPLFDAAHGNLQSPGGVPSITEFSKTRAAMRVQKSRQRAEDTGKAKSLNIATRYVICPAAQETEWGEYMSSTINPDTSSGAANPIANAAEVVADARLDDDDVKPWYLAAGPDSGATIEVATLDGIDAPRLEQQTGFTTDGVAMKVSIDGAAAAIDWRGLQKNEGGP